VPLFALAMLGAFRLRRDVALLAVALLAYVTIGALLFAGATRYRVSWDFLLALSAAAAVSSWTRRR
jgi:hypothetical protein